MKKKKEGLKTPQNRQNELLIFILDSCILKIH
jgi:hypothetical protein